MCLFELKEKKTDLLRKGKQVVEPMNIGLGGGTGGSWKTEGKLSAGPIRD